MNIRATFQGLHPAKRPPSGHAHKAKFNPRADILDEVVAGLLWLALDLPADVSRPELESFARHLVAQIRFGTGQASIEHEISLLQSDQLGRSINRNVIHGLAERVMTAVKGY